MPQLTINDQTYAVPAGQRLALAIEAHGVKIGHRCGGQAKCTTCRVTFAAGEPETFTAAEHKRLTDRGLLGQARLACQIVCDHDMAVTPLMTLDNQPAWTDTGPALAPTVEPAAEWFPPAHFQPAG